MSEETKNPGLVILRILSKREEYLKSRLEELNKNQSKDITYNYNFNIISGRLSEISFISQLIQCTMEELL